MLLINCGRDPYSIIMTCRSTVIEQGAERPSETWDFHEGDIWYFRPNEGHMIQGLEGGCTYLSGEPGALCTACA